MAGEIVPAIAGIAAGGALLVIFAIGFTDTRPLTNPNDILSPIDVTIPKNASLGLNFQPVIARAVAGIDFIRWHNRDAVPARIEADNTADPSFYESTRGSVTIPPGGVYEFTFKKPGEYAYHGAPWQHGKIIVIEMPG